MNKVNFHFFCLYNFIYKDGFEMQNYQKAFGRGRILPESRAILGLFFSTWLWTVLLRLILIALFSPTVRLLFLDYYELIIALGIYACFHFYFINNNRFTDIYIQHRFTERKIQLQGQRRVFLFLALPLILIPLAILAINNYTSINLANH
jgi:Ca2+/Na+ antiporter